MSEGGRKWMVSKTASVVITEEIDGVTTANEAVRVAKDLGFDDWEMDFVDIDVEEVF